MLASKSPVGLAESIGLNLPALPGIILARLCQIRRRLQESGTITGAGSLRIHVSTQRRRSGGGPAFKVTICDLKDRTRPPPEVSPIRLYRAWRHDGGERAEEHAGRPNERVRSARIRENAVDPGG